ncbi:hypothetical protein BS47DRAFT_105886 [Hydnum rufescens UP504]|uniref:Uncharacterized protein n=1 Tax=Hydnum rufescens UP504 TaxID=1448309 RepID=A0A9P6DQH7_9AGAM|nr:hypothetical protein BS47DRAFT_105886 [Hydnum rufescens UP504]
MPLSAFATCGRYHSQRMYQCLLNGTTFVTQVFYNYVIVPPIIRHCGCVSSVTSQLLTTTTTITTTTTTTPPPPLTE